MPEVSGIEKLFSLWAKKRLGKFPLLGTFQLGFSLLGDEDMYFERPGKDPILLSGIYRTDNVTGKTKNYREPYYITRNPRTVLQQANRAKYAAAVAAWKALTPEEKMVYNERAKGLVMSGYNLFIREFMLS